MLVGSRTEGLIIASEQPEDCPQEFIRLRQQRVPFVLVDRFFPGQRFRSVRVDDLAVGRLAADHLVGLGHRRIGHIRGPKISPASLRCRGFESRLRELEVPLDPALLVEGSFDMQSGAAAMRRLLGAKPRPTAVFAGNDPMALGALSACRDAGVSIPEEISLVGAGNIEGDHLPTPFLSTVDWPRVELGRIAANLLISAIANPNLEPRGEIVEPRIVVRGSSAAPAKLVRAVSKSKS
jgi:DNA-binding LacI/PurR family transcriptional regulator